MRSSRLALTVTAFALLSALTACSGDSDSDDQGSGTPSTSASADAPFEKACVAKIGATGTAETQWKGRGTSTNASGVTMYTAAHGDDRVAVYAGNDQIPISANITVGGATFTTTGDSGLDVNEDGSSAMVMSATSGIDGAGPQLTATFTCGKTGTKKKG